MDESDLQELIDILRDDPDADERMEAAVELGKRNAIEAFDDLLYALENDPDEYVRGCSARALGSFNDVRAIDPLIRALDDESAWCNATEALGNMRVEKAVDAIIRTYFIHVAAEDMDQFLVFEPMYAVPRIGVVALKKMLPYLNDPNPSIVKYTIWALECFNEDFHRFESYFIKLLAHQSPYVQEELAVGTVMRFGSFQSIIPLKEWYLSKAEWLDSDNKKRADKWYEKMISSE